MQHELHRFKGLHVLANALRRPGGSCSHGRFPGPRDASLLPSLCGRVAGGLERPGLRKIRVSGIWAEACRVRDSAARGRNVGSLCAGRLEIQGVVEAKMRPVVVGIHSFFIFAVVVAPTVERLCADKFSYRVMDHEKVHPVNRELFGKFTVKVTVRTLWCFWPVQAGYCYC